MVSISLSVDSRICVSWKSKAGKRYFMKILTKKKEQRYCVDRIKNRLLSKTCYKNKRGTLCNDF